ncbi:hypothetical protein HPP92_009460 [Vanilla planifolia]|uniref:Pentatricopeptide repeat-containing protein n=1 Tax=Vanilla planifolia TaxID=51239 RepID=A0A835RFW3_VANPL|nr:hypothetical protein HPP92_009460 [Vanilla planifolia]
MAWELFVRMPDRNLVSWSAMISGYVQCRKPEKALALFQEMMKSKRRWELFRILGDVTSGEIVGKQLIQLEPRDSGCYVQLANLYASSGRWQEALAVRDIMKRRGVVLEPGCSLIEWMVWFMNSFVGIRLIQRQMKYICVLDVMARSLRVEGYVLNNAFLEL